ncbi:MAG: GntR family transcriptional regulator [Eubacteriales bacterium]|nr:GntR family transcriptional regulator [Eubacteriales bacterium]
MSRNKENLSQPVYDTLLQRIMRNEISAGERISENKLATEFGVSRTVIHTVLLQLKQDGLIKMIPRSSPQIEVYSADAIKDIGTIRVALDTLAIKLAMLYGSQADYLELEKLAKECQRGLLTKDEYLQHTADSKFHLHLAKISQNRLLYQFQNDLYLRVNFILLTHHDTVTNHAVHVQDHFDLIQAMLQRDERYAQEIITRHLISYYNLKENYPPHFFSSDSTPRR